MDRNGGTLVSPTEISQLALKFLTSCRDDPSLMTRVYHTAMSLVGASVPSGPVTPPVTQSQSSEAPKSSKTALTPDEARRAKEEFRQKLGIKTLTPQQAKIAKQIFRDKKTSQQTGPSPGEEKALAIPQQNAKKPTAVKAPDPNARKAPEGTPGTLETGTRTVWNAKLKMQKQRALERSVIASEYPNDILKQADYFNAYLTLENTWNRFQRTFESLGKNDPLGDLPKPLTAKEIQKALEAVGLQSRQHETGHFILKNEQTGQSLPKLD
jgi:hypothetical protein